MILVAVAITLCSKTGYTQTTYNWLGTTNNWTTSSNWSPAGIPTANDNVQIGVTVTFTNQPKVASGQTANAASITFGTKKASPTLTISGALTVNGNITMNSSSIVTMDAATACTLTLAGNFNGGGTFNPSTFANSKLVMNGTAAQYFPNTTALGGNIGIMDIQNVYYGSTADRGVTLNTSVTINHTIVENNAIFDANGNLVAGTSYYCTIGTNATYISKSTFNFRANDVIDPTSTLEFTATNQTINLYKTNAGSTNIPPNVLFTGTNITVNGGTSPNNATIFKVLGNLTVQNSTNSVTFDPALTLIDVDGNFSGNGSLSSGSLPINIGGSWLNTAAYNVGGNVTYDGNNASGSCQVVSTTVNYQKDVVFTGATPKQVATGTMKVAGNLDNSAGTNTDFVTNSSTLLMDGSGTQYIKGGTATNSYYPGNVVTGTIFNNVTISTTGAGAKTTLQGNNNISPLGVLTINNPASLDATASNSLTFLSDGTSTASFASLPAGSAISGSSVNVQRFVKGSPTDLSKRAYRLISSTVYTGTVSGVNVFDLNYLLNSVLVSGAAGGGFNATPSTNPSNYLYREDIVPSDVNFTTGFWKGIAKMNNAHAYDIGTQKRLTQANVADTTVNIPVGNGVLFFFRGNKTNNGTTAGTKTTLPYNYPEDVILTQKGTLNTGTVNVKLWFANSANGLGNKLSYTTTIANAVDRGFTFVGNPYACTINWEKYNRNSTVSNSSIYGGGGLGSTIYMLNATTRQFEAYMQKVGAVSVADTTTNLDPGTATGSATNMIASGEGFFVRASSTTQSLSFRETAKTTTQPAIAKMNNLMGKPKETGTSPEPLVRLQLIKDAINNDEVVMRLNDKTSPAYSSLEDAEDMGGVNPEVSMSVFSSDSVKLCISRLPFPRKTMQVIPLLVNATASGTYRLKLSQVTDLPSIYTVRLKDNFTHDSVNMHEATTYSFNIDPKNSATFGPKRFQLIIGQDPKLAAQLLNFEATKTRDGSRTKWKVKNEFNYTIYYVERSIDKGNSFEQIGRVISDGSGSYTFLDDKPVIGDNLYRLKQFDLNKDTTYSNVVRLSYSIQNDNITKISIFPNPAASTINLAMGPATLQSGYTIRIMNSAGTVVKQSSSQQSTWKASIGDLKPGTYLVQVTNSKSKSLVGVTSFVKD